MNSLISQKLQLINLLPDKMEHLKRPKELYLQLAILLSLDILAIQPNFLAEDIASKLDSFIVSLFLEFLSIVEILTIYNH